MKLCAYCHQPLGDDVHDANVLKPVHKLCLDKRRNEPRTPPSPQRDLPASVARMMPRWR